MKSYQVAEDTIAVKYTTNKILRISGRLKAKIDFNIIFS